MKMIFTFLFLLFFVSYTKEYNIHLKNEKELITEGLYMLVCRSMFW